MQNENGKLKIHTNARPQSEMAQEEIRQDAAEQAEESRPEPIPRPRRKLRAPSVSRNARRRDREAGEKLTTGERLLRNTAVACALLLSVMALKNVDHPWSRQAAEGIKQAMTMRVDWDETLGKLSFVRALVPDTALVFLNLGESTDLSTPVNGVVSHSYTQQQPWLEYRCAAGQTVCAAMTGTVTAAGQGMSGDWIVLIEGDDGAEAVYGYLASAYVQVGQQVEAGQQIGVTADREDSRLYFELREDGEPADPSARMK